MSLVQPAYVYRARLSHRSNGRHAVYDGDTVWITVDYGFGGTLDLGACRLFGINAPELRGDEKVRGRLSRDFLRARLNDADWFIVETIKDKKGKYGRYLVNIWVDGVFLNKQLVEQGHAVWRDY